MARSVSKAFSVIADEATDLANDEQLSISVRYFDNGIPQEKFLGFHECLSGVSGEATADNSCPIGCWSRCHGR